MSVVSEIMSPGKAVSLKIDSTTSVLDATNIMIEKKVGSVVIVDVAGNPIGIITESDVIKKVTRTEKVPRKVAVQDIMSRPVLTVESFDSIDTAAAIMAKNKVKRLVVLEQDGAIAGMISSTDIAVKLSRILTDEYHRYGHLKAFMDLVDK
jgi:CBS domain-containing protein